DTETGASKRSAVEASSVNGTSPVFRRVTESGRVCPALTVPGASEPAVTERTAGSTTSRLSGTNGTVSANACPDSTPSRTSRAREAAERERGLLGRREGRVGRERGGEGGRPEVEHEARGAPAQGHRCGARVRDPHARRRGPAAEEPGRRAASGHRGNLRRRDH